MKIKKDTNDYSEEYVKKHRTFPMGYTVLLVLLILFQVGCILFIALYQPAPQDRIDRYNVTVTPFDDGTLAIEYDILWCALDEDEPLTWVTIGMPNSNFGIYQDSMSDTIQDYWLDTHEDYVGIRLDLKEAYSGGETVHIAFTIHQYDVLCKNADSYFYEFVPGWFNRIPVTSYEFKWKKSEHLTTANGKNDDEYYVWSGQFECGEYEKMKISYAKEAFEGCETVAYRPFDGDAYNELQDDKSGISFLLIVLAIFALVGELYIIDGYVSYQRGRGFLSGYGHRVHVYGRINPHYSRARALHAPRGGGGRIGGGCACACACACAGGGRAGCSQKDTFSTRDKK